MLEILIACKLLFIETLTLLHGWMRKLRLNKMKATDYFMACGYDGAIK